jgi:hypothetical protein
MGSNLFALSKRNQIKSILDLFKSYDQISHGLRDGAVACRGCKGRLPEAPRKDHLKDNRIRTPYIGTAWEHEIAHQLITHRIIKGFTFTARDGAGSSRQKKGIGGQPRGIFWPEKTQPDHGIKFAEKNS